VGWMATLVAICRRIETGRTRNLSAFALGTLSA